MILRNKSLIALILLVSCSAAVVSISTEKMDSSDADRYSGNSKDVGIVEYSYFSDNFIYRVSRYLTDTSSESISTHKDLFPMTTSDVVGTILVGVGLMIAASGGVGGGGILVPLLILVFGFHPKYAVPLSNFTILGSSITNMVLNTYKRHPETDRPLVDWDLIVIMEPLTMAGAIVGALIGILLPDWLLVILLVILLAQTTYTTLIKAVQQYKKETIDIANETKGELVKATEMVKRELEDAEGDSLISDKDKEPIHPELVAMYDAERLTPIDKVYAVILLVVVVVGLNYIKGGGKRAPSPIGVTCGSQSYWFITCLIFAWIVGVSLWMRSSLIEKWKLKTKLKYKYVKGDIEWNERSTIIYPCICFFAGLFAGMFGVGGGIVKGPLMLQMNVHPAVASGTVAVMIMFTSVSATTMFYAFGTITWDYAWFLFVVGLITTTVGQFGVGYLVDKYKRYSFISFSIGAVVAISTVLMAVQSVFSLIDASNATGSTARSIC